MVEILVPILFSAFHWTISIYMGQYIGNRKVERFDFSNLINRCNYCGFVWWCTVDARERKFMTSKFMK